MNPERNRENNEIQEINQPKQSELSDVEKDEMKRDLEANPPTLDHHGELEQVMSREDVKTNDSDVINNVTGSEEIKSQDESENTNVKEDVKVNADAQNDVGDKNSRLEHEENNTVEKSTLDVEPAVDNPIDTNK